MPGSRQLWIRPVRLRGGGLTTWGGGGSTRGGDGERSVWAMVRWNALRKCRPGGRPVGHWAPSVEERIAVAIESNKLTSISTPAAGSGGGGGWWEGDYVVQFWTHFGLGGGGGGGGPLRA